ncbi:TldD/PmbA family protein [Caenimonas aquaedulcis]|uniref:TldD/PmbA family protein n=1 Tax=Caenimonas aquaedulcis TaxID=2793270 RepID=A0A931MGF0_9BURK|nr:TldD/PmbA family protein [Caenimonas aquaedulcis]MBG9387245.1 TldD/PmbA family protein [Caenimonas aquaedulcis]
MDSIETLARRAAPAADFWSARALTEQTERIGVRDDVPEPPSRRRDAGVMVSVIKQGGLGYAATSDLSESGLRRAFGRAAELAQASAARSVFDYRQVAMPKPRGSYRSPNERPAAAVSLREKFDMVQGVCASAKIGPDIVDRSASIWTTHTRQVLVTADGGLLEQEWDFMVPGIEVVASANGDTQTRSAAGQYNGFCQQGGLEVLDRSGFAQDGVRVAREAVELVHAPNCPTGEMDVLLMPDQMMLQIHESIGHPLELDRILGDERNYAGTSFVTMDMFGSYQYGSELLNVSFAPDVTEQFATFGWDDDGAAAERQWIIRSGLLVRPLGGTVSQARARALGLDLGGVSTTRACSWNRAPIDRMSNLNIEPGHSTLEAMIASIDHGILMRTNSSWSIDDSRNKFQFGCEYGRMIRGGKLAEVVKRPNYRGISAGFWRSLAMVGDAGTFEVMGTPYCGKGEPNQVVRVGHAAPACKFTNVSVFGGAA